MDMCDRVERGEEKLIPIDEDFFKDLEKWAEESEEV
jgi:DNA replication initiation complex subunit (GINS family)